MMKPFLLWNILALVSLGVVHADPFADPVIQPIQELHSKAVEGDKETVKTLIDILEKETKEHPENKLLLAYLGSAYTLRSRDLFYGPAKMRFLKLGIKTMDDAVTAAPADLAVRFIRAMNNYELPQFFGRREIARTDFQSLQSSISIPAIAQTLNVDTIQAIYYYAGLAYKDHSDHLMARSVWNDGIKLAPTSPLGEKIAIELNKLKS